MQRTLWLAVVIPFSIGVTCAVAGGDESPGAANTTCSSPMDSILAVTLRPQQASNWCWAASGEMVMEYLGKPITQCVQANDRFNRSDCCSHPTSTACNRPNWPYWQKYGFTFHQTTDTPLTWDVITRQLAPRDEAGNCKFTPFAFSWYWEDGGGHMMVASGYRVIGNVRWLQIDNPFPVNKGDYRRMSYDEYISGDDHTHWNDYYDVAK